MLLIFFVPLCAAHHTVTKENVAETQIVCREGNILKTIKFMLFFLSFAHLKAGYVFFFVFCCFTTGRILNLIVALTSSASQNKQFQILFFTNFFSLFFHRKESEVTGSLQPLHVRSSERKRSGNKNKCFLPIKRLGNVHSNFVDNLLASDFRMFEAFFAFWPRENWGGGKIPYFLSPPEFSRGQKAKKLQTCGNRFLRRLLCCINNLVSR